MFLGVTGVMIVVSALSPGVGRSLHGRGAAVVLLRPDLREQMMMGDAGANPLGAATGLATVLVFAPSVRVAVLVVLLALNLASEWVSFSQVIERTPPLRYMDRLGRRD
ncbi:MAG: hypothetical protein M5U19_04970 [Microthrixaceae bacterium]|nr:hypothetical protein [Microthrixaceae bacterium]